MKRVIVAVTAWLLLLVPMASGAAATELFTVVRNGAGAEISNIQIDAMYPTAVREDSIFVTIGAGISTATAAVVLDGVEDIENGCLHPETAWGDVTCGSGSDQGELAPQLVMTVTPGRPTGLFDVECQADTDVAPVTGTLTELAGTEIAIGDTSAALGRSVCFLLRHELPDRADNNLMQGDHVSYDLRILGDARVSGNAEVQPVLAGESGTRTSGEGTTVVGASQATDGGVRRPTLAATGGAAALLLGVGVTTLIIGMRLRRRAARSEWSVGVAQAASK